MEEIPYTDIKSDSVDLLMSLLCSARIARQPSSHHRTASLHDLHANVLQALTCLGIEEVIASEKAQLSLVYQCMNALLRQLQSGNPYLVTAACDSLEVWASLLHDRDEKISYFFTEDVITTVLTNIVAALYEYIQYTQSAQPAEIRSIHSFFNSKERVKTESRA